METINGTEFHAAMHAVRVDHEGESKVTLTVPQSDLDAVLPLAKASGVPLIVSVRIGE